MAMFDDGSSPVTPCCGRTYQYRIETLTLLTVTRCLLLDGNGFPLMYLKCSLLDSNVCLGNDFDSSCYLGQGSSDEAVKDLVVIMFTFNHRGAFTRLEKINAPLMCGNLVQSEVPLPQSPLVE